MKDIRKASYLLSDQLGFKNFKVADDQTIRLYDPTAANEIAKAFALHDVELISIGKQSETLEDYFIALFVGMSMKSSKATLITAFLLIFLTQANIGDLSLAGNAVFPVMLTALSLIFAVLTIRNAETRDLM